MTPVVAVGLSRLLMYLICATPYVHAFQVHALCLRSVNGSIAISWSDEQMGILDFVRESLGLQKEEIANILWEILFNLALTSNTTFILDLYLLTFMASP